MKVRRKASGGLAAAAVLALTLGLAGTSTAQTQSPADLDEPVYWEVSAASGSEVRDLQHAGFDVAGHQPDGTVTVVGDTAVAEDLRAQGFAPEYLDTVYKDVDSTADASEDSYYGGYLTAAGHYAHLEDVAAEHPELTELFDIGESWLKTQGEGGHDIKAICVTERQDGDCELDPDSDKPRITLVGQLHAREIATGEVASRFVDHLLEGYGDDAEVTELLETTEVWVVPIANPDGVDIVSSGGDEPIRQRKNANDTAGNCSGIDIGVDLNRNHSFKWGDASTDPCNGMYMGESALSEPETVALEGLFTDIHPEQRGSDDDDPAPDDARDVMITLHSHGNFIIHPWGWTEDASPNAEQLAALGEEMAEHNGYTVGTSSDTLGYLMSGATDDFTYGELGVASYTFEIGSSSGDCGGFLPLYSCMDTQLWEPNRDAIMTAALAADAPYGG